MRKFIGTCLCTSLVSGAFFCVGMGMEMTVSPTSGHVDHSCCPESNGENPVDDAGESASCCLDLPGIAGSSLSAPKRQNLLVARAAVRAADIAFSSYSRISIPSNALLPDFGHPLAGAPRAPPVV